jgi:hypothetical protein
MEHIDQHSSGSVSSECGQRNCRSVTLLGLVCSEDDDLRSLPNFGARPDSAALPLVATVRDADVGKELAARDLRVDPVTLQDA